MYWPFKSNQESCKTVLQAIQPVSHDCLPQDIWLKIICKIPLGKRLKRCMPVCRAWRALVLECTTEVIYNEGLEEPETNDSLVAFIERCSNSLQTLDIQFLSVPYDMRRILEAVSKCKDLKVCQLHARVGSMRQYGLNLLPQNLHVLHYAPIVWSRPGDLTRFEKLRSLSLHLTHFRCKSQIEEIGSLGQLRELKLQNNNILSLKGWAGIANLSQIHTLWFGAGAITDSLQQRLSSLSSLRQVGIGNLRCFSDSQNSSLVRLHNHPSLECISLLLALCTEEVAKFILTLEKLKGLRIDRITDQESESPWWMLDWSKVKGQNINIREPRNIKLDLEAISRPPKLRTLNLMGCESVYIVVLNPTINKHVKQRGGKIEILDIQGHNLHISGYSMTERQDGKKMGLCFKALDQKGEQIKILRR